MVPKLSIHGVEMPRIGFGTSQLGNCGEIVATALKLGYRNVDTAWKYGTEDGVGKKLPEADLDVSVARRTLASAPLA